MAKIPMRDVSLPKSVRRTKFKGAVYTLPEITTLLANCYSSDYHGRVAFAAVAVAAFTGLRLSRNSRIAVGKLSR